MENWGSADFITHTQHTQWNATWKCLALARIETSGTVPQVGRVGVELSFWEINSVLFLVYHLIENSYYLYAHLTSQLFVPAVNCNHNTLHLDIQLRKKCIPYPCFYCSLYFGKLYEYSRRCWFSPNYLTLYTLELWSTLSLSAKVRYDGDSNVKRMGFKLNALWCPSIPFLHTFK
jgi:hypothetical protein